MRSIPRGKPRDTGYLLAHDPATGNVLERHLLPGFLRGFAPQAQGIEITYARSYRRGDAAMSFSHGRFERPLYALPIWLRGSSAESGLSLAVNFMHRSRTTVLERLEAPLGHSVGDAPDTLTDLKNALRRAIDHDPTQPWHLFLLGEILLSLGEQDEAASTWRKMFAGSFPAIPYSDYSRMAFEFERFDQRQWADRAYEEALRRRQLLPHPIEFSIFRFERFSVIPAANPWSLNRPNLERRHVWLERARQLSGVTEGDEFEAAAWEGYYRQRGDIAKAKKESEYRAKARDVELVSDAAETGVDYCTYAFLSATLGLWALAACVFGQAGKRRRLVTSIAGPTTARRSRFFPTVQAIVECTRLSTTFISMRERTTLIAAMSIALAAAVPEALFLHRVSHRWSLPAASDALGHVDFIQYWENKLKSNVAKEVRFAAAVANHLGGNPTRATALYESLADDPRASRNLVALRKGNLIPPEPLTGRDVLRAHLSTPLKDWITTFGGRSQVAPGRMAGDDCHSGFRDQFRHERASPPHVLAHTLATCW